VGFWDWLPWRDKSAKPKRSRRADFVAGRQNRRNADWLARSSDASSSVRGSLKVARDRSRDLQRNNRYQRHSLLRLAQFFSGVTPRSAIKPERGASKAERERVEALNQQIDAVWDSWALECTSDGRTTFAGLQFKAVHSWLVSGESWTRLRLRRASDGLTIPLQLELLEADFVDHTLDKDLKDGGWIRNGVEHDPIGRIRAYWMFRSHPGDNTALVTRSRDLVAVPASSVAHLFDALTSRPGQRRGMPWNVAIIQSLQDFDDYADAERLRMYGTACLMAFVESPEDPAGSLDDTDEEMPTGINPVRTVSDGVSEILEELRSGTVAYLQPGTKVSFHTPRTADNYEAYVKTELHGLAAGAGMPYELFAGDLSDTNFSSIMFGMGAFWDLATTVRFQIVVPLFGAMIWKAFVELGVALGTLPDEAGPVEWHAKPFPLVDPEKQGKAWLRDIRAGARTLRQYQIAIGSDPERTDDETLRRAEWARDNELILDSIPTVATQAGQAQQADPVDSDPDPE
jgi:lambda family phage portal protein